MPYILLSFVCFVLGEIEKSAFHRHTMIKYSVAISLDENIDILKCCLSLLINITFFPQILNLTDSNKIKVL